MQDGSGKVTVTGAVKQLLIDGDNTTVAAVDAEIDTVELNGEDAQLTVDKNSTVNQATVNNTATGATIAGDGKVKNASIKASNVAIDTVGTKATVAAGAAGVTSNGQKLATGQTVTTTAKAGNSTTGSSNSGSGHSNSSQTRANKVTKLIEALPGVDAFTYNDRPAFYTAKEA